MKCRSIDPNELCTKDMECYINAPKYFNCFIVYQYYIQDTPHTLQEVAALMDISHTTVKQIESSALNKIRDLVKSGNVAVNTLNTLLTLKN